MGRAGLRPRSACRGVLRERVQATRSVNVWSKCEWQTPGRTGQCLTRLRSHGRETQTLLYRLSMKIASPANMSGRLTTKRARRSGFRMAPLPRAVTAKIRRGVLLNLRVCRVVWAHSSIRRPWLLILKTEYGSSRGLRLALAACWLKRFSRPVERCWPPPGNRNRFWIWSADILVGQRL